MKKVMIFTVILVMFVALIGCGQNGASSVAGKDNTDVTSKKEDSSQMTQTGDSAWKAEQTTSSSKENVSSGSHSTSSTSNSVGTTNSCKSTVDTGHNGNSKPVGNTVNSSTKKSADGKESHTSNSSTSSNPPTSSKPIVHTHTWEKCPQGTLMDWSAGCGPDENGYTTNVEVVTSINVCGICHCYFGRGDISFIRYMEHSDMPGPCYGRGYYTVPVRAVYELYECPACYSYKRGELDYYGYISFTSGQDESGKWFYLTPQQIEELGLK